MWCAGEPRGALERDWCANGGVVSQIRWFFRRTNVTVVYILIRGRIDHHQLKANPCATVRTTLTVNTNKDGAGVH